MRSNRWMWALAVAVSIASTTASAGDWKGYMNVFENAGGGPGAFVFGSPWGVSDLKTTVVVGSGTGATITNNVLDLYPNYNTYSGTDPFWVSGTVGNKWMEALTYVEPQASITASSWTFNGDVSNYTLSPDYTALAFVRAVDPANPYAPPLLNDTLNLSGLTTFSITTDLTFYQGLTLQVGFDVQGVNANPAAAASLGSVRVKTSPSLTPTEITINVPSGTKTQAQAGYTAITGTLPVLKTGAGTVVFNAVNPYTALTSIQEGTLQVSNTAGLTASPTTVSAGAALAVTAPGSTGLSSVTLGTGAAMTLRSDIAQTVSVQSLDFGGSSVVTIDSTTGTSGYMNVSNLPSQGGAYQFGSGWGIADLNATYTSSTSVTFTPNTIGDPSPYWYTPSGGPGATGNKIMEANLYTQPADGTMAGKTLNFRGNVADFTLLTGTNPNTTYTFKAFIRDFSSNYGSVIEQSVPISATGEFSVTLTTTNDPSRHVQWGLQMKGPDVWVTDVASKGKVVVNASSTMYVADGGKVDVGRGIMNVASGLSATELVVQLLGGRGDGSWTGTSGVTSSAVAADVALGAARAVGWLANGDGSVTFAYAAPGDTNLDWRVDNLDITNLTAAGKYNTGMPATWAEGDFNYDGVVDVLDASFFFTTGLFNAGVYNPPQGALGGVAAVPEPSAVCLLAAGGLTFLVVARRRVGGAAAC